MAQAQKSIRGMNDILPAEVHLWQHIEREAASVLNHYAYDEIRMPLLEKTDLFTAAIGQGTDVVEKEMYTFEDRNGDSLSLRPEGTAGCVRAMLQNGLLNSQKLKLWYTGPMFRHERPQRGRTRQFHQIGAELYGLPGPDADAELILMAERLWKNLAIREHLSLEINSLGNVESRHKYRDALVDYFSAHKEELDEDSLRRLDKNPLRILDSKNPEMKSLIESAPAMMDYFDEDSSSHFSAVCELLDKAGISYRHNPKLVRGLDYYSHTVFEWITDKLGSQSAVCAGGRYDGLIEIQGGKSTPAVGFAMGMERLVELHKELQLGPVARKTDLYLVAVGEKSSQSALALAERIRDHLPALRIECNLDGGSFKAQFKRADKSGADYALVLGDEELENGTLTIKFLRSDQDQQNMPVAELIEFLAKHTAGH